MPSQLAGYKETLVDSGGRCRHTFISPNPARNQRMLLMGLLLTVAGTVAAVQLFFGGWREWCAARRIVAVGGLDVNAYEEHGCVPLQFAGSRFWVVSAAVAVTGFFMVRPKTRKQAFAAREIVGVRDGRLIDYCDIRPRDRLRVMLDEGEHPAVFDRSMRRGVVSFYRTVAIREIDRPGPDENAHCVTVRTQGHLITAVDDAGSPWLEYEVTSAAPRSNRHNGPCLLADMPEDAIEAVIIPTATYQQVRDEVTSRSGGLLRRRLMRHNPNPFVGVVHVAARYAIPLTVLVGLGVRFLGWSTTSVILVIPVLVPVALFAAGFCIAVPVALGLYVRDFIRVRRPSVEKTRPRHPERTRRGIPLAYAKRPPPREWTGATAYSMSAGRISNGTDAHSMITHEWRQFANRSPMLRRWSKE